MGPDDGHPASAVDVGWQQPAHLDCIGNKDRGELLGDHPMGVMDHKGMTNLVTGISCTSVPNLATKKNTISGPAEKALFFDAIPIGFVFPIRSTGPMAARDDFGRS